MHTSHQDLRSSAITPAAAARFWKATLHRDPRADGTFFFAVRSTQIYCRPSCPARRPLRQNTIFFRTTQDAERQGFRPCRRCRPKQQDSAIALVQKAAAVLASEDQSTRLADLAAQVHSSPAQLRRAFRRATGVCPKEFEQAIRLARFKRFLRDGSSVTDALYACGYGSSSRLYEKTNLQLGMTPVSYRKGGQGMEITYTVAATSLGKVLVASTERGVSAVYLGENERDLAEELYKEYPKANIIRSAEGHENWLREIVRRVEGNPPSVELPLDVQATAFQRRVWQELQKIPRGATRTYTQVAKSLGQPRSVRAVARACATNPVSILVPCHRVIRSDGALAGYRWGLSRKQKLLEKESAST